MLLVAWAVGTDEDVASALPVIRDVAAMVMLVSGRRPEMKLATLEGNGEADA